MNDGGARQRPERGALLVLLLAAALAAAPACEGGDGGESDGDAAGRTDDAWGDDAAPPGPPSGEPTPGEAWHEHAFAADPTLRADLDDVVVVSLESGDQPRPEADSGGHGADEIPYAVFEATRLRLCGMDVHGDPHEVSLVADDTGRTVLAAALRRPRDAEVDQDGCVEADVPPGHYTLRLAHAPAGAPDPRQDGGVADDQPDLLFVQPVAAADPAGKADSSYIVTTFHVLEDWCPDCPLSGVDLRGHQLDHVILTNADLTDADLRNTRIGTDELRTWVHDAEDRTDVESLAADLSGANFTGAKLTGATFVFCDLRGAVFSGNTLDTVSFTHSNLRGALFGGATLKNTQLGASQLCEAGVAPGTAAPAIPTGATVDLTGSTIPFDLFPVSEWRRLTFDGTTVILPSTIAGTVFDGIDLSGALWAVARRTSLANTSWVGTGALLGAGSEADLRDADFSGAGLRALDLAGADLSGADLAGADLTHADLTSATLQGVTATYATFADATLTDTVFDGGAATSLYGADLRGAQLDGAHLTGADLAYADLAGPTTTLNGAHLAEATLTGATVAYADLTGAGLRGATLVEANLIGATLTGADFTPSGGTAAKLDRAWLCSAALDRTDFSGAVLTGAYFPTAAQTVPGPAGVDVTCGPADVSQAVTTRSTVCPSGAHPAGSACAGAEWTPPAAPEPPCCTPPPGGFCPPRKRAGEACTTRCECRSSTCAAGHCAP